MTDEEKSVDICEQEHPTCRPTTLPATPAAQDGQPSSSTNMQTVTRKARSRQQTVTVENQTSKEVQAAFDEIRQMDDLVDPIEELHRRMQRLFLQREKEWAYKLNEMEQNVGEELALCKIKLNAAMKTTEVAETFLKHYKVGGASAAIVATPSPTSPTPSQLNGMASRNGVHPSPNNRTISPDAFSDVLKERNALRDELRELENSYSDLFKRYEKMRENCVLLKNSEECLKKSAEDEAAKYERLAAMYSELRATAANELNKANTELERVEKQHEENTLNLRCRLKRNESEITALSMTIQGKDGQIDELNKLCDELMRKNGVIDEETATENSYDEY